MGSPTLAGMLVKAIGWAAGLNSSTSARWPTPPSEEEMKRLKLMPWQVWSGPKELIILVINKYGQPQALQQGWEPGRLWPQTKQTLVASIFHIDDVITVVMADGFEDLIEKHDR